MRTRGDTRTLNLLEWEPPQVSVGFDDGEIKGWTLSAKIARAVSLALTSSDLSRAKIAEMISNHLGQKVSKDMLDAYASESRTTHKISLERFIALIEVTGCHDLLGFVSEMFGFSVVPDRFADIIELHLIEEHERDLDARKSSLQAKRRRRV